MGGAGQRVEERGEVLEMEWAWPEKVRGLGRKVASGRRGHGRLVRWAWSSGEGEKGGFREKSGGAWSGRGGAEQR